MPTSCVDGRLHVSRRTIDIPAQIEYQNNKRVAELAIRSHLGDAGDAAEHALERSSHGRGHRLRAGAREIRGDHDHRVGHFGHGGDREREEGQRPRKQKRGGKQRGGYRAADEWSGNIHV